MPQKIPEQLPAPVFFLSFFDAEQPAQNAAQTLWAFDNDHLHRSPAFRGVIPQYKRQDGKVCGSGLVPGQDRCIRHRFHDHQRPLAGGDGDAIRAFGVLVADAQRIPCREDGIRQLIVGAALTDALRPALQREDGNVEELRLRVGALLAGADEGDAAALISTVYPVRAA